MTSPTEISVARLTRLIGLPDGPLVLDVRDDSEYAADPFLVPAAIRADMRTATKFVPDMPGRAVVVVCGTGGERSQSVAALLRAAGVAAETLEGGFAAWRAADAPLLRTARLHAADDSGRTVWVTRARPKVDRIACPWLIRRFVDPRAIFLYVPPSDVVAVAERLHASPFDIEGVFWSHRGETCTFDTMIEEFGLRDGALLRLAAIVRGADTARPDLAPQAAGLLAASLGLSRMHRDDLRQLEAGMALYDAFYRWARDASEETHNWPTPGKRA